MPEPRLTPEILKDEFPQRIHKDIPPARLKYPISAAKDRLLEWVGETNFNNEDLQDLMIFAWANLAMHFAILGINTHIRTSGIISSEQVEGNTVNTYLKPDAIETLQTQYLNLANSIVRKYLIESDIENPGSYIPAT